MAEALVDIRQLWTVFQHGEQKTVVHQDLNLSVGRGEIMSLVGGSGTGKTVLLRQMLGLETPAQGEITVLGKPAAELGKRRNNAGPCPDATKMRVAQPTLHRWRSCS